MVVRIAIAVFVDKKGNVIVQKRGRNVSKTGERYGFFGGQIEKGETPTMAVRRELKEEMGFVPRKIKFWGKYSYRVKVIKKKFKDRNGWLAQCWVFLSPITATLKKAKIMEGEGSLQMKIDKVIEGRGFPINSVKFMRKVKKELYG